MSEPLAIRADGLEKSYGKVKVLAGVDLRVERGSIVALLGPNGAGKTTIVRILSTLLKAGAGQAWVAGFEVAAEPERVRSKISLTGQHAAVDDMQTGEENLRMMGALCGLPRPAAKIRARELLARFDLTEAANRRVSTYSGGMRRKLDLAASLIGQPSVIFLDEPTTGLDPRSRQSMWAAIKDLANAGVTILLTTQYLEEADQLADQIVVIDGGRVVAKGAPAELKRRVAGARLELTIADGERFERIARQLGERVVARDPDQRTLGVATDGAASRVRELLDEIDPAREAVTEFSVRTATLDDVFLALTDHAAVPAESELVHA